MIGPAHTLPLSEIQKILANNAPPQFCGCGARWNPSGFMTGCTAGCDL